MFAPCDGVRATFPFTPVVTRHSWRSLSSHRCYFPIPEVVWASSHGSCLIRPAPMEVAGLDLLWQRSLIWVCFHGCPWLGPVPSEIAGLGLAPHTSVAWAWSCSGHPQRLLAQAYSLRGLPCTCSCVGPLDLLQRGHWLGPVLRVFLSQACPAEWLVGACSPGGHWLSTKARRLQTTQTKDLAA